MSKKTMTATRFLTLLLLTAAFSGCGYCATTTNPPGCATRPCTYTITCATSSCTDAERAEIQTALDDAEIGDTIILDHQAVFDIGDGKGFVITPRPGVCDGSSYLTIVSDRADRLPDGLVTPEMRTAMPTFSISANGGQNVFTIFAERGAAGCLKFDGLRFTLDDTTGNSQFGYIQAGLTHQFCSASVTGSTDEFDVSASSCGWLQDGDVIQVSGTLPSGLTVRNDYWICNKSGGVFQVDDDLACASIEDVGDGSVTVNVQLNDDMLPRHIFVRRVLTERVEPWDMPRRFQRRAIAANADPILIKDSWLDGVGEWVDHYAVWVPAGGKLTIENSFSDNTSEGMLLTGGAIQSKFLTPVDVTLRAAISTGRKKKWTTLSWQPSTWYEIGTIRKEGGYIQAQNSGTSGVTEPTWCPTDGCTNADNEITWKRRSVSNLLTQKNRFETKTTSRLLLDRSYFGPFWPSAHNTALNIRGFTHVGSDPPGPGPYNGFVDTSGTTVTWVSGDKLPALPLGGDTTITINGVTYTIDRAASNWLGSTIPSQTTLQLTTSASLQAGVPYSYGYQTDDRYMPGGGGHRTIRYNRIEDVQRCVSLTVAGGADYFVRNGVWEYYGNFCSFSGAWSLMANTQSQGLYVEHNTHVRIDGSYATADLAAFVLDGSGTNRWFSPLGVWRNNIFGNWAVRSGGCAFKQNCIEKLMFGDAAAPVSRFDKNVFLGAADNSYSTGTVWDQCSGAGSCGNPDLDGLFVDQVNGDYRVRSDHAAFRNGTDGYTVGANMEFVPAIEGLGAEIGETTAILSWRVTAGIAEWACTARISEDRDLLTTISYYDLSAQPEAFNATNASVYPDRGVERMVIAQGLTPGTTYYFGIYCGGVMLPVPDSVVVYNFTTAGAGFFSGPGEIRVFGRPAAAGTVNRVIEYGSSYDRAADAILIASETAPAACTPAASCLVTLSAAKDTIVYFRTKDLDAGDQPVAISPVRTALVR